jgi:hypothetical protein
MYRMNLADLCPASIRYFPPDRLVDFTRYVNISVLLVET